MFTKKSILFLAIALLVAGSFVIQPVSANPIGPDPELVEGNPTCEGLGYAHGVRIDPPTPGTYPLGPGTVTFSSEDGVYFTWTASYGVDAVIVKGGNYGANLYRYDPPAEAFGGSGLHAPVNPSGKPAEISHIDFCFDYELLVSKTAIPSFKRTWTWDLLKTGDQTELTLSPGQQFLVNYAVTLSTTGYVDSDWAVSGAITIVNPDPKYSAEIVFVSDAIVPDPQVDPFYADCGAPYPITLEPGGTLVCTYSTSLPNGMTRTNKAMAHTKETGFVGTGWGSKEFSFTTPTTQVDDCVSVTDNRYGSLGAVCAGQAPKTFNYSYLVGPYEVCGEYKFTNTAEFTTNTTGTKGSDTHGIDISVPCGGCTLTQGYWKTHSKYGPAPYDSTWAQFGEDITFFLSGKSNYQVLWTPPAGLHYYNLAHQYIAAKLNILNGAATTPQVLSAISFAETFFTGTSPSTILTKTQRADVIWAAGILDAYNNGYIGPGHCDE